MNRPDFLTPTEASDFLSISPNTLANWRAQHVGPPFVRIGRRIRYRLSDLLNWMDRNTVSPMARTYR